jgi:hypothetical protein
MANWRFSCVHALKNAQSYSWTDLKTINQDMSVKIKICIGSRAKDVFRYPWSGCDMGPCRQIHAAPCRLVIRDLDTM